MFCQKCGNKLPDDSIFCQKCGARSSVQGINKSGIVYSQVPIQTSTASYPSYTTQREKNHTQMRLQPKTLLVIGGIIGAVILIIVISSMCSSNLNSTSSNAISVTPGSTFRYLGMEYTIGNSWSSDGYMISVPIVIKNISNNENANNAGVTIWSPDGISIYGWFGSPSNTMRAGASQNSDFLFEDHGDGIYIIELSQMFGSGNVDVIITIPIWR